MAGQKEVAGYLKQRRYPDDRKAVLGGGGSEHRHQNRGKLQGAKWASGRCALLAVSNCDYNRARK